MSLLSNLLPKKETTSYFLTLAVEERKIRAAVARVRGSVVTVMGIGESTFAAGENETEAADMAISSAESESPDELLVEKVVFALPIFYLDNDNVKPEYLSRLKKITKDLNLKPNGFIEYPQALAYSIEREEGSPATAILLHLERTHCTFSLIRVGKIYKNIVIDRRDSIIADFANTIPKFETEIMPSRIILFDHSEDLENIKSELLKFPWHKNPSFLHTPKVEILSSKDVIVALVEAAASSLLKNMDVTVIKEINQTKETPSVPLQPETDKNPIEENKEIPPPVKKEVNETTPVAAKGHLKIQGGVVHLIDDPTAEPLQKEKIEEFESKLHISEEKEIKGPKEPTQPKEEESFGFVESTAIEEIDAKGHVSYMENTEVIEEKMTDDKKIHEKKNLLQTLIRIVTGIRSKLPTIQKPKISPSLPATSGNIFLWIIPAVLILLAFLYYSLVLYPRSTVSLIIYPFSINQNIPITFKTSGELTDKSSIAVAGLTTEVSGEKTIATTGKNQIGERSKGELLIYNKTNASKAFPKGTILTNGDIRFTIDTDVTVASASDTGEGLQFGKITIRGTAVSIGPNGNIAGGTSLKFKDFPDTSFTAKANQSFSGGTSREIASVSKEDQTNLEKSLTNELTSQAKEELNKKLSRGEKLLDVFPTNKVISKKFSGDIGSEGKNLTLSLTLSLTGYSYKEADVTSLARENLTNIPTGYSLSDNSISIKTNTLTPDKDGNFKTNAQITATLFPQFDQKTILSKIAGKSYPAAEEYLKTVEGVSGFAITSARPSFLMPNHLPIISNNILLTITAR